MRFPLFWKQVKDDKGSIVARGWSDSSLDEAHRNAEQRLARILSALRASKDPDRYQYVIDNVICEYVVDRIFDKDNREIAVISRNAYGSLILNTPCVMFIDIDVPPPRPVSFLARLFGRKAVPALSESMRLEKLRQWQSEHQDFCFRVYRTAAGLRVAVTNREFSEIDSSTLKIMEEVDADPLYRELCRSQSCFRARLMPKPWRIGVEPAKVRFPFESETSEKEYANWFGQYLQKSKTFGVCQLVESMGAELFDPTARQLIGLHDDFCCRDSNRELA